MAPQKKSKAQQAEGKEPKPEQPVSISIPAFKNGRMFVGYRLKDWKRVYYMPYKDDDPNPEKGGLTPSLYFTNKKGQEEDPMGEGEIAFEPYFTFEACEATTKVEKKAMRHVTLTNAHMLLSENDPHTYWDLMKEYENPGWARWTAVMSMIRRFKDAKMTAKDNRRANRAQRNAENRAAGVPESGLDDQLTEDEDGDSGIEDDHEVRVHSRRSKQGPMNPPSKRSSSGNNSDSDDNSPRRRNRSTSRQNSEEYQMSGARQESADFDPSPPERNPTSRSRGRDSRSSGGLFVRRTQGTPESAADRRERYSRLNPGAEVYPTAEDNVFRREAGYRDATPFNGGMTEDEALAEATRASQEPTDRTQENVVQSTEEDVTETTEHEFQVRVAENGGARPSASVHTDRRARASTVSSES